MIFKLLAITLFTIILLLIQSSTEVISSIAALSGVGYGLIFFSSWFKGIKPGRWEQRFLSFLIGMAGIGILYIGLKIILPSQGTPFYQLCRFLRYLMLGIWISFSAPWIFILLGLVSKADK